MQRRITKELYLSVYPEKCFVVPHGEAKARGGEGERKGARWAMLVPPAKR